MIGPASGVPIFLLVNVFLFSIPIMLVLLARTSEDEIYMSVSMVLSPISFFA